MIGALNGTVAEVLADGVLVDVGGVGYRVLLPVSAIATLPPAGKKVRLHTHLHVREDALALFGFATAEQRDLFEILLGVNGIGPKGALAVLGMYSPQSFRKAVVEEDLDALTLIPGVGKKTAARMILELRERLGLPDADSVPGASPGRRAALSEVRSALVNLGYTAPEARQAIERLPSGEEGSVEDLLKMALKELARA